MNRLLNLALRLRLLSRTWRLESVLIVGATGLTRTRRVYGWRIGPAFAFRSRSKRPAQGQRELFK